MSRSSTTILDVVYELLSLFGPLTVEQMTVAARQIGYEIRGWEIQAEIEEHMLTSGENSLFLEITPNCYALIDAYQQNNSSVINIANLLPSIVAIAVAVILGISILIGNLIRRDGQNSIYLPSTLIQSLFQPEVAFAADSSVRAITNHDWWFEHPINQMNDQTQQVARKYLANFYNTCGPTVVAKLVNFTRSSVGNPDQVSPADVLQDAHSKLGYYTPPYNSGLLTFNHLRDMLKLYDLAQTFPEENDSLMKLEDLLNNVRLGQPAIVGMRYRYQDDNKFVPAGGRGLYNHFVIVFGHEQIDGQEYLWISNPHPGKYTFDDAAAIPTRIPLADFWQSWALKDGSKFTNHGNAVFFSSNES